MGIKRRKILIIPEYQLHYALVLSLCFLPVELLFLFVFWEIFDLIIARVSILSSSAPEILIQLRASLMWKLVLIEVAFWIASFVVGILMSHRTAGPLYKLAMAMKELREGKPNVELHFRKYDFFKNLADEFNALASSREAPTNKPPT
jgi:hypothetical protein